MVTVSQLENNFSAESRSRFVMLKTVEYICVHVYHANNLCVLCVCVYAGDPGAGEPRGDIYHPGRGWLSAMHPGSVLQLFSSSSIRF